MTSTATILCAAALAGLIAGAVTSAIDLAVAEPLIERAIRIEEDTKAEHGAKAEGAVVSRAVQRKGLVIGLLVYGALWGALFGALYLAIESFRGVWEPRVRGRFLAIGLGWAVAWFPFLKYPANPPGVGDSATIVYRQLLYLGFVVLSAGGALAALTFHRRRSARDARLPAILYGAYAVLLYIAMPGDPDPIRMPADLVWSFRGVSLVGLVVFWVALGFLFEWIAPAFGRTEVAR